ncbi:hypothetical protein ABGB12_30365 [Actinocorallia sp. B10E7]|uniref:hypothetical protein n=1 Tax=Actinocorallia sp. B10E7 TaxID=3153558 RepID=UPI00325C95B0
MDDLRRRVEKLEMQTINWSAFHKNEESTKKQFDQVQKQIDESNSWFQKWKHEGFWGKTEVVTTIAFGFSVLGVDIKLFRFDWELRDLRQRFDAWRKPKEQPVTVQQFDEHKSEFDQDRRDLKEHAKDLDEHKKRTNTLGRLLRAKIDQVEGRVRDTEGEVRRTNNRIDRLRNTRESRINTVQNQVQEIRGIGASDTEGDIRGLRKQVEELIRVFSTL